jgi:hypothetical protein
MTTQTASHEPSAPTFHLRSRSRLSVIRGLVVFCLSALIAAGFLLDVAGGVRPKAPAAQLVTLTT